MGNFCNKQRIKIDENKMEIKNFDNKEIFNTTTSPMFQKEEKIYNTNNSATRPGPSKRNEKKPLDKYIKENKIENNNKKEKVYSEPENKNIKEKKDEKEINSKNSKIKKLESELQNLKFADDVSGRVATLHAMLRLLFNIVHSFTSENENILKFRTCAHSLLKSVLFVNEE